MNNHRNGFDQPVKNNIRTYKNIRNVATRQGDDYTTDCLLDYAYFKGKFKLTATDLGKQQALGADPKALQQINFAGVQIEHETEQCLYS